MLKYRGLNEIREKFLAFFEGKEHFRLKSFPLVPQNDNSLLLINSGMAPLKPYFTGRETPPSKRVTTCQKCIRTGDLENVGITTRHGTFFEMLGNFSFGDYFKHEIIPWAWEFMTGVMEIPAELLYVSVYEEDDEAYNIWQEKVGLAPEKIKRLGKDDNFWEVGIGPCGPCSEIYFDRGPEHGCKSPDCGVGCDCDRYVEIWNLVFTQFDKQTDDSYLPLAAPNIDTGMGLERVAAVTQGVSSIFDVDTIRAIRDEVCKVSGKEYNADPKTDISIRIITDHIRSVTFMTADGIQSSNEGRGYVLRRLLRRAALHGKLLGIDKIFLSDLSKIVIDVSGGAYPELKEKSQYIHKALSVEEDRFYQTLDAGIALLKKKISELQQNGQSELQGDDAFKMYDTFGFPLDLLKEICAASNITVNEKGFEEQMREQKARARESRETTTYMGSDATVYNTLPTDMASEFVGYDETECAAKVLAIISGNRPISQAGEGDTVAVILDKTVLYPEKGGQKGDKGVISSAERGRSNKVFVSDCIRVAGNKIAHIGVVGQNEIRVGDYVMVTVDKKNRLKTSQNHTATHLLQKSLRMVLGHHVEQAGSMVSPNHLRFDFTHFAPLTEEELEKVELIVNEKVMEFLPVVTQELPIEEAREKGAMALFGEKYGDTVRVVEIGHGVSIEFCGGTHVDNTGKVGIFRILSETGSASGTRRIEALTGSTAIKHYKSSEHKLKNICKMLKATPENVEAKVDTTLNTMRGLLSELDKARSGVSNEIVSELAKNPQNIGGISVITGILKDVNMDELKCISDKLREKSGGVVILASSLAEKVNFVVSASKQAVESGANAGAIVKIGAQICGGGGGGKPNMATAGGKDPEKIDEAVSKCVEILTAQLGART
ncbi:alanine--tRNA ligase [Clostridia bacterium]|nr:alanine--tRNA ligase [Clostridia bacterium]